MANHHAAGGTKKAPPQSLHFDEKFENPYNFVPAPPRCREHPTLGDALPAGHHRYLPGLWSGRISVELTTVTPLLIPDQQTVDANGHKTFGVRTDGNGAPYLPPTSIKGALRAAYEAVTNSRMGVFDDHAEAFAFRTDASESVKLVPCRIVRGTNGQLGAKLLTGQAAMGPDGRPQGHGADCLMYAAWLPRYDQCGKNDPPILDKGQSLRALPYAGKKMLPAHGERVFVETRRRVHRSNRFAFLQVTKIQPAGVGAVCPPGWDEGWVCVSGPNVMNKHEERVFLLPANAKCVALSDAVIDRWRRLILDYRSIHAKEIEKRADQLPQPRSPSDYLGHEPGQTGFSRHVFVTQVEELIPGALCYAAIRTNDQGRPQVQTLYPVSISRDLYRAAPYELLDQSLQPAKVLSELSPADRLFGWVGKGVAGQYKGQLRIGATRCLDGAAAIEPVGDAEGVPLAILGAPKPAQARFYGARDRQGTPYRQGTAKAEMYRPEHGLRGRKFYPHQKMQSGAEGYWDRSARPPELGSPPASRKLYREWRMPDGAAQPRTDQNRSITAWVRPGARFSFDLQLTNVSSVELGALLWLLSLDDDCCLRVGCGKPLGFGSVRLRLAEGEGLDLCDGEAIRSSYASFGSRAVGGRYLRTGQDAAALIADYQKALAEAVGSPEEPFDRLLVIKALLNAARGGNVPVHYPRTQVAPNAEGENYKWFVANENWSKSRHERHSLPALADDDRGLWVLK